MLWCLWDRPLAVVADSTSQRGVVVLAMDNWPLMPQVILPHSESVQAVQIFADARRVLVRPMRSASRWCRPMYRAARSSPFREGLAARRQRDFLPLGREAREIHEHDFGHSAREVSLHRAL